MAFEASGSPAFIVNNDQAFTVTEAECFFRRRENVCLVRDFEGPVFTRDYIERSFPRVSANPQMTKLSPNREIERIYATW